MRFAPGATRAAAAAALVGLPLFPVLPWVGVAVALFGGFVLWFHRDPERTPPESGVVSPADGRVSVIREEEDDEGNERVRVGVFMNVTDVHVNRAPLAGTVETVEHRPGAHLPAFTKESERNERVRFDFGAFEVDLIAGAFARRIHPYAASGESFERGERIGHVSFGSRADVLLPAEYTVEDVRVTENETVRAGETVVAER
ncbi:protein sorting system archaetidylserine decarboxylase [Halospeciosus flavus]|uniref:Protein sorting system archaetidylserine decarboxylase n=1 Tax=Halospeciosus flavus TaxID=3032283 RepID=A0ABD5Z7K9_9EURY